MLYGSIIYVVRERSFALCPENIKSEVFFNVNFYRRHKLG